MDDALLRHELLRRTYLEAREDLVDVLIERIRHEIRRRFPEAEYLSLDSQVLDDGRLELKAAGLRSGRSLAVPTDLKRIGKPSLCRSLRFWTNSEK